PGMKFGGFKDYSKQEILAQIPQEFIPTTTYLKNKNDFQKPAFPSIVKPDLGERGVNVQLIKSEKDWQEYPLNENLIVQEFIDFPLEFGIFYAKLPDENSGKILSITGKEFLTYKADGTSTLRN